MLLVGVLPEKIPLVKPVEVKVTSTSPWTVDGLIVVKPETLSFTIVILHLPSIDVRGETTESLLLQEINMEVRIAIENSACFIHVVLLWTT